MTATLDDENVGRFVALLEDEVTSLATGRFQAAENFLLLIVGDAAKDRDLGKDGHHRCGIFQRQERGHSKGNFKKRGRLFGQCLSRSATSSVDRLSVGEQHFQ